MTDFISANTSRAIEEPELAGLVDAVMARSGMPRGLVEAILSVAYQRGQLDGVKWATNKFEEAANV